MISTSEAEEEAEEDNRHEGGSTLWGWHVRTLAFCTLDALDALWYNIAV